MYGTTVHGTGGGGRKRKEERWVCGGDIARRGIEWVGGGGSEGRSQRVKLNYVSRAKARASEYNNNKIHIIIQRNPRVVVQESVPGERARERRARARYTPAAPDKSMRSIGDEKGEEGALACARAEGEGGLLLNTIRTYEYIVYY